MAIRDVGDFEVDEEIEDLLNDICDYLKVIETKATDSALRTLFSSLRTNGGRMSHHRFLQRLESTAKLTT
jgi:hypothetical protein